VEVIEIYHLISENIFPAFFFKNLGNQDPNIRVVSRQQHEKDKNYRKRKIFSFYSEFISNI